MKILITTDWYIPTINGVVNSITTLKKELETLGAEVKILTLNHSILSETKPDIYYIGSLSAGLFYTEARISPFKSYTIIDEIIEWQPDIVHSQCEFSTFPYAKKIAKKLNIPLIHTYHTIYEDYTHYYSPSKRMGQKAVKTFTKNICKQANTIIAPTQKVKTLLENYKIKTPIDIIPTGINLQKFEPITQQEKRTLRQKYNIKEKDTLLITISRLGKEKNIETLINNYKNMNNNNNIKMLIVGDGPYRHELEKIVNKNKLQENIQFTGIIEPEKIAQYYAIGDIFVSASQSETQGITYIEALASGIPLVCYKDPSLNNVIINGITGYQYTTTQKFEQYIHKIQNMTKTQLQQCNNICRLHAQENFSAKAFGQKVYNIYTKNIENHKKNKGLQSIL